MIVVGFQLKSLQFYLHIGGYGYKRMELTLHNARVSEFIYLKLVVHITYLGLDHKRCYVYLYIYISRYLYI